MRFFCFRNSLRWNRDNVGPVLNIVRAGMCRSEILYVLSASVTSSRVCQACVLWGRTLENNQQWMGVKPGVTWSNYTLTSPWDWKDVIQGCGKSFFITKRCLVVMILLSRAHRFCKVSFKRTFSRSDIIRRMSQREMSFEMVGTPGDAALNGPSPWMQQSMDNAFIEDSFLF